MRLSVLTATAVAVLSVAACNVNGDAKPAGLAELSAIKLPSSWKTSEPGFIPDGMNRPYNEWYQSWSTDVDGIEATRVFTEAAHQAGWAGGTDGNFTKAPYRMDTSTAFLACDEPQKRCSSLSARIADDQR